MINGAENDIAASKVDTKQELP